MIFHVYKKKRTKNGKAVTDRCYRGRYRLDGDYAITELSLETADKQVAEQKLREIVKEKEMERSGLIAPKLERDSAVKPLDAHLEDFVADLKIKGRAERYWKSVDSNVQRLCRECGWKTVKDVSADDFLKWRSKQTLAPKTLNEYLNAANVFLNWLVKHGRTGGQPLKHVEKVDVRGKQQKRRAITDEEFLRLLKVSEDYRLLYITAIFTGLRLGELSGLVWSNVKLEDKRPHIHVPAHLTKNRQQAIVPLHPMLVKEFLRESANQGRMDYLFPHYCNPDRRFQRHRKEAGIESIDETGRKLDFHSFRYTFATKLARQGVSQRLTQELMRHSDPRLTANLYTDVSHLPTFEAVQNLEWFDEPSSSSESNRKSCPHIGPQNSDSEGHFLSQIDISNESSENPVNPCGIKEKTANSCEVGGYKVVGETGFEPATSGSQNQRSTKLSYSPRTLRARTFSFLPMKSKSQKRSKEKILSRRFYRGLESVPQIEFRL